MLVPYITQHSQRRMRPHGGCRTHWETGLMLCEEQQHSSLNIHKTTNPHQMVANHYPQRWEILLRPKSPPSHHIYCHPAGCAILPGLQLEVETLSPLSVLNQLMWLDSTSGVLSSGKVQDQRV